jgi:hypothetical protein
MILLLKKVTFELLGGCLIFPDLLDLYVLESSITNEDLTPRKIVSCLLIMMLNRQGLSTGRNSFSLPIDGCLNFCSFSN